MRVWGLVQEWTVQCNTEVKYGQILVKNKRLYIFCVFILYANNVYCSKPKRYQCIIKVIYYLF